MTSDTKYRFHPYRFDTGSGELTGPHGTVRLQPQPAQVLGLLLARAGELVTRDELKSAVWPTTVVEADQGLNYCIRQIRSALEDEAESGRFIETLPRRGYRFVQPVHRGDESPAPGRRPRPPVGRVLAVAGLAVAAAITALTRTGTPVTLAVLPLATAGGDSTVAALNRALTEQIVNRLTNSAPGRIDVIGPSTTASLIGGERSDRAIGRALGADYVVSGGVSPVDSTLFVQVIRVSTGVHRFAWRQPYRGRAAAELGSAVAAGIANNMR